MGLDFVMTNSYSTIAAGTNVSEADCENSFEGWDWMKEIVFRQQVCNEVILLDRNLTACSDGSREEEVIVICFEM